MQSNHYPTNMYLLRSTVEILETIEKGVKYVEVNKKDTR